MKTTITRMTLAGMIASCLSLPARAEELYSCLYNGTSSTYREAEATRMKALGAVCDKLGADERITCAIDGVKLDYSREESRRLMAANPGAVCEVGNKLILNAHDDKVTSTPVQNQNIPRRRNEAHAGRAASTPVQNQNIPRRLTLDMSEKTVVHFRLGSSKLSRTAHASLANFSRKYGSGAYRFTITGYADASGSSRFNHTLSLKRAGRVRDVLIDYGISEDNILSVDALGEESLRFRTRDGKRSYKNRAVEVRAYK